MPRAPRTSHRHLVEHDYWSNARIDDVLDRGRLDDWLDLRDAVALDQDVALRTLRIAQAVHRYGSSTLWSDVALAYHPTLVAQ